ncbi:MAG: type II secretion system protein [Coraliomargaritaceae bacterium]
MTNRTTHMRRGGFTLIELLAVIALIVLASSILFVAGKGGSGAALDNAKRIVSGIASGARGQAILKNTRTRLIVYTDKGTDRDDEKYRRFFGIVYEDKENPNQWIAATQGTYLPSGIYFDADLSDAQTGFRLEYPRSVSRAAGSGEEFSYYEFSSNGNMSTGPVNFTNTRLIIRAGSLQPSGGELDIVINDDQEYTVTGLIFRRAGTTTPINNPEEALK